jgi:3-phosphoshikimate 1-carboxyvinyltransferase
LNPRTEGGEPVADLRVFFRQHEGLSKLPERAPSMIDEHPILSVVAACATGKTVMRGAEGVARHEPTALTPARA